MRRRPSAWHCLSESGAGVIEFFALFFITGILANRLGPSGTLRFLLFFFFPISFHLICSAFPVEGFPLPTAVPLKLA